MSSSTASKRQTSNAEKRRAAPGAEGRRVQDAPPTARRGGEISERAWLIACVVILLAATALRFYALELKPLHHDEGVNGFFLTNLLRQGVYRYDPSNYHGPTLYYLTLPFVALFGLKTFVVRAVTAAFGVATVWLVLALRRHVGAVGALTAAALVAVSPACVFYSRYFIHESLFVFFTLAIVVAALRFYEQPERTSARPHDFTMALVTYFTGVIGSLVYFVGRRASLLLFASASAALLFATKETAFISIGTLALAWLFAYVWVGWAGGARGGRKDAVEESGLAKFFASEQAPLAVAGAVVLFVVIWVLFYSSFGTNWKGVWDSFEAFRVWKQTGMSEFHSKPFETYVDWLWQEEAPILLLAVAGTVIALLERRKNRFAVFASAWAFGLLVAYSLIHYKTPWLVLSFVVPLAIVGGYAVQRLADWGRADSWGRGRVVPALIVAAIALAVGTYQTLVLNFREYDNDRYPYVYSHTQRQALEMLKEIERAAARAGTREPGINVASPEYWPLPWYFRDNSHVGYIGSVSNYYDPKSTLMVIGRKSDNPQEDQYQKLRPILAAEYVEAGTYPLRPGVTLVLFERRDLAGK